MVWANVPRQNGFNTVASRNHTLPNSFTNQELDYEEPGSGSDFEKGEVFLGKTNEFTIPVTDIYLIAASLWLSSSEGPFRIGNKDAFSSVFLCSKCYWVYSNLHTYS